MPNNTPCFIPLRFRFAIALVAVGIQLFSQVSPAHELRPAYLEIRETTPDTYDVLWKVPARGETEQLSLRLKFGADVELLNDPVRAMISGSNVQRFRIRRTGGLDGTTVFIPGLSKTLTDVILRYEKLSGVEITERLTPDSPKYTFEKEPGAWRVAWTYFVLGFEHILGGIDHLLFVLALLLLVDGRKKLVWAITAFTVSHSITLALATLGYVHAPGAAIEAVIALSIMFVAAEIIHTRQGMPGLTARKPWIAAFVFGLLHGFGFAGALSNVGLPETSIPMALFTFNVGVEAGQLAFVSVALIIYAIGKRTRISLPSWSERVPAYIIGSLAAYWTIERIMNIWKP